MEKPVLFFVALLSILSFSAVARADMGMIQADEAKVSEGSQKAIILHNGQEEVLILGTVLQADRDTQIIRFIPFPSEPQVSPVEGDPFKAVSELIKKHKLVFLQYSKSGSTSASPVEISFNARIGAHDITVIKINEISQFKGWVNDFFAKKGFPVQKEYPVVEAIAADYLSRGFAYFVFDLVELGTESQAVEPLVYRFASKDLYYPLKTSNSFGGEGGIDLIFIGPGTLCATSPFGCDFLFRSKDGEFSYNTEPSTSAEIQKKEAQEIYPAADEFFSANKAIFMQIISYYGSYDFKDDIIFDLSKLLPYAVGYVEEKPGSPWIFPVEELLKEINGKCELKPESGTCKALFWRYYFDPESSTCREFAWGGCDGVVPFETMEECTAACVKE